MNDRQRVIMAASVCTLFIAIVFFVPWKRNDTGDIRWAPFYQNPITYEYTFADPTPTTRFAALKGRRMYGLYIAQILAIAAIGGFLFQYVRDDE